MILMSHEFPYGNSETSFIGPELEVLYQHFDIPAIFTFPGGDLTSKVSEETKLFKANENEKHKISFGIKLQFSIKIFIPWLVPFLFKAIKFKLGVNDVKIQISQMIKYLHLATFIHHKNIKFEAEVLYSYWFDHWNVAACIYKKIYNNDAKIVSRAHRYEIDVNTNKLRFFPFQKFQFKNADLISFISSTWRDKLALKYPKYKNKLKVNRMGVAPQGINMNVAKDNRYHIVTISGNIPVKRIHLQLEALNKIDLDITWHHFGAEENDKFIENGITNPKLLFKNYGFYPSVKLLDWLKNNYVHFLINTSKIEGVPVSMMECISLGIPIFAMDVGGIKEIVNTQTGVLVENNDDAIYIATELEKSLQNYQFDLEGRKKIIQFFEENYSATRNYNDFCTSITQT